MRRPARKNGMAVGSRSIRSSCSRVAPYIRNKSTTGASADNNPWVVFTTIGKKLMRNVTVMMPGRPGPAHNTMIGASTMTGVICSTSSQG